MGVEDKDVIKEQLKKLSQEPGSTLSIEEIKELVNSDSAAKDFLDDDEIEGIILISAVEAIQKRENVSSQEIAKRLGFGEDKWWALVDGENFPTPSELIALRTFVTEAK